MESSGSQNRERGGGLDDTRIQELKEGIARYRREVERTVQATGQIGIYYKMLALQYMQRDMYGEAYESLQQAIQIHPENSILFHYAAVCAGRMSLAMVDDKARTQWLARAEKLYRRALALDQNYVDAMYGLAVLLTFELERPEEAEGLLERILDIEKNNLEAMFLLGNVYYRLGRLEEALETYRRAAAAARVPERREEALANQRRIEGELYGAQ
jgi:tetratricopeptide (TPR) repeat protein